TESDLRGEQSTIHLIANTGIVRRFRDAAYRHGPGSAQCPGAGTEHASGAGNSGPRQFLARALSPDQVRTPAKVSQARMALIRSYNVGTGFTPGRAPPRRRVPCVGRWSVRQSRISIRPRWLKPALTSEPLSKLTPVRRCIGDIFACMDVL